VRNAVRIRAVVNGQSAVLKGRVVRAKVKRLAKSGIVYEVAVTFDACPLVLRSAIDDFPAPSESTYGDRNAQPANHALCA
jgi:hypothetical protein